ncbi:MAG: aminotransferase class III-fold pyridoxal phosphate-dependent enzyme [Acidobacteriota bacterium]
MAITMAKAGNRFRTVSGTRATPTSGGTRSRNCSKSANKSGKTDYAMDSNCILPIIQVRMGSTRFPGKALADIGGHPMLWHVVHRVRASQRCGQRVVVATSTAQADDAIEAFCKAEGVDCFRGGEQDVLDRYYQAAAAHSATAVVRITADCPLLDPAVMDQVIDEYQSQNWDYVSNTLRYTYPDGLDVEVFSFDALEQAWKNASLSSEREHVTPWIRTCGQFRLRNVACETDLSPRKLRWTVDEPADLEFVRQTYAHLDNSSEDWGWKEILSIVEANPEIAQLNQDIVANAGYYRSLLDAPVAPTPGRVVTRSLAMKERALNSIPSCAQTFSKGPSQFVQGVAPVFLDRAKGSLVWDVDGNQYIDYISGLGPVILGHGDAGVNAAVTVQLARGVSMSLPSPQEVELAELLCEMIPCAEMVRFGKNGSDATAGAVRAARAFTGREVIACCGYHGWQDWYIGTTTRNKGVPEAVQKLTIPFEYNNLASLERIFKEHPGKVAAVIMEPVGVVAPKDNFLQRVRECAHAGGALLIFDEIITGFRMSASGAQHYFGVTPDLATFGKAMGNGFPISAIVGRRDVMQIFDEIFFSFTFGGELVSIAAALETVRRIRSEDIIPRLWAQGQKLQDGYNTMATALKLRNLTECIGYPPRTALTFRDSSGSDSLLYKSIFQQEVLARGVLSGGYHFLTAAHSDADIDHTLRSYGCALRALRTAIDSGDPASHLRGKPVEAVFRRA